MKMEQSEYRFTQRDIREYTGWGHTQTKMHLGRLVELEYVMAHRGGRGQSFVYELLYEGQGQDGSTFIMGLIDVEKLRRKETKASVAYGYDAKWSGQNARWSGLGA